MAQEFMIALGSNLGSNAGAPTETLATAVVELARRGAQLKRVSRIFATPCFPPGAGPDYANACIVVRHTRDAHAVLQELHDIERDFGRARQQRWGSRSLDLDLLAAGSEILPDRETHARWRDLAADAQIRETPDRLVLPHPRLQDRAFVLVPLADVAPDWRHPVLHKTVADLCAALPEEARRAVTPIDGTALLSSGPARVT